jgi:hypothetical protein
MFELSSKGVGLQEYDFANYIFIITHLLIRRDRFKGCLKRNKFKKIVKNYVFHGIRLREQDKISL